MQSQALDILSVARYEVKWIGLRQHNTTANPWSMLALRNHPEQAVAY